MRFASRTGWPEPKLLSAWLANSSRGISGSPEREHLVELQAQILREIETKKAVDRANGRARRRADPGRSQRIRPALEQRRAFAQSRIARKIRPWSTCQRRI